MAVETHGKMDEKTFFENLLQLLDVSIKRGTFAGQEISAVAVMRELIEANIRKYEPQGNGGTKPNFSEMSNETRQGLIDETQKAKKQKENQ